MATGGQGQHKRLSRSQCTLNNDNDTETDDDDDDYTALTALKLDEVINTLCVCVDWLRLIYYIILYRHK